MKTAEEWATETLGVASRDDEIKLIKQIQRDALEGAILCICNLEIGKLANGLYASTAIKNLCDEI